MRVIDARGCFFVGWSCCLCAGVVFLCGELFSRQSCFFAGVDLSTGVVFFVEVLCAALFFARELFLRAELFARELLFGRRSYCLCGGVILCARELFFYARSCLLRSYCLHEGVIVYAGVVFLAKVALFVEVVLCAALFFVRELFFYARSYLLRSYCLCEELFFA